MTLELLFRDDAIISGSNWRLYTVCYFTPCSGLYTGLYACLKYIIKKKKNKESINTVNSRNTPHPEQEKSWVHADRQTDRETFSHQSCLRDICDRACNLAQCFLTAQKKWWRGGESDQIVSNWLENGVKFGFSADTVIFSSRRGRHDVTKSVSLSASIYSYLHFLRNVSLSYPLSFLQHISDPLVFS